MFLAAPVTREIIEREFAARITRPVRIEWDAREAAVIAAQSERLGALVLVERRLADPDPAQVTAAMLTGIRALGLAALPWTPAAGALRNRMMFARALEPEATPPWPDTRDVALLVSLEDWLAPWLDGMTRRAHLTRLDLVAVLRACLDHRQSQRLDALAPAQFEVPSGSRIAIDCTDPLRPPWPCGCRRSSVCSTRRASVPAVCRSR